MNTTVQVCVWHKTDSMDNMFSITCVKTMNETTSTLLEQEFYIVVSSKTHRKTPTCRAAATSLKRREEIFNVLICLRSCTLDITHYGGKTKIIYMNVY